MPKAHWKIRASPPKVDPETGFVVVTMGDFIVPVTFEATAVRDDVSDWPPITMQIAMDDSRPVVRRLTIGADRIQEDVELRRRSAPAGTDETQSERTARREVGGQRAPKRTRPINASFLREIPLARLAKHAMLGVAWRLGEAASADRVVPHELLDDAGFYALGLEGTELQDEYGVYLFDQPAWDDLWTEHMQALAKEAEHPSAAPRRNRITDELLARVAQAYRHAIQEGRPPKKAVQAAERVSEATAGRYIMRARKEGHLGPTQPGKKGELAR
jgi:hypothetical protein